MTRLTLSILPKKNHLQDPFCYHLLQYGQRGLVLCFRKSIFLLTMLNNMYIMHIPIQDTCKAINYPFRRLIRPQLHLPFLTLSGNVALAFFACATIRLLLFTPYASSLPYFTSVTTSFLLPAPLLLLFTIIATSVFLYFVKCGRQPKYLLLVPLPQLFWIIIIAMLFEDYCEAEDALTTDEDY